MVDISKPQYKMLVKIHKRNQLPYESLSEEEKDICSYLLAHNLICVIKQLDKSSAPSMQLPAVKIKSVQITQAGMAQIYTFKSTFYKWWIPVVISIIALILSAIGLLWQLLNLLTTLSLVNQDTS